MTEKRAYQLSLDLWIWLFKNPGKLKGDWDKYYEIEFMISHCPLCQLFFQETTCKNCIGKADFDLSYETCFNGCYRIWANNYDNYYHRKIAAAYIASKIRRYMRKKGWIE